MKVRSDGNESQSTVPQPVTCFAGISKTGSRGLSTTDGIRARNRSVFGPRGGSEYLSIHVEYESMEIWTDVRRVAYTSQLNLIWWRRTRLLEWRFNVPRMSCMKWGEWQWKTPFCSQREYRVPWTLWVHTGRSIGEGNRVSWKHHHLGQKMCS